MTTGMFHDQKLEKQVEKQMGCMTGFLQIFDRHQILVGKRLYATKRLPPSPAIDSTSHSEKSVGSPVFSSELQQHLQQQQPQPRSSPECTKTPPGICSPVPELSTPAEIQVRTPPLPVFEFKEALRSSWKFRESPRLSLDSRATVDGKGSLYPREIRTNAAILSATRCESSAEGTNAEEMDKQRRSPSVIARLMGLEALPDSGREPLKKAELRRSASESRSGDLQYRFIDGNNFQLKQSYQPNSGTNGSNNAMRENAVVEVHGSEARRPDLMEFCVRKPESAKASNGGLPISPWKLQQQRRSFFDSQDFFPEPKQTGSLYGEIEKRLKMRGIDEPAKDLETLKQILEALQLKGLLHTKKRAEQIGHRNFVFDRRFSSEESPIVIMKPSRSMVSMNRPGRTGNDSPPSNSRSKAGIRRNLNLSGEKPSRYRPEIGRNLQTDRSARNSKSPDRSEGNAKSPSSLARRKPLSIETQRRGNDSMEQRRSSPIHSPKITSKKTGSDQTTNRSPRNNRRPTVEISPKERITVPVEDESSSISESSISTSSQNEIELQRPKMENYKEGRSLLERCDKLLHSIAEITAAELQPSPVSVLDSSFYKDESSPSPVMKRCIDFKDQSVELDDENRSPVNSPVRLKSEDKSDDCDYLYVSEILRASDYLSEDSDVFLLLEKQQYKTNSSKISRLHRKLVFDTITEILDQKRQLPPWKVFSGADFVNGKPSLRQIWLEFSRMRERETNEDLLEVICGVLRKDMGGDGITGWRDCPMEMSEAVLDIERLIFKDLVAETIRDLAAFTGKSIALAPLRRKLVF